jgi:cellulose synthase (UDP-forming)
LNNALRWTDGEFVAVIDADHRAVPSFAHSTLGYFEQDDLALVATPQRVVNDRVDPLNNQEPFFYRSLMLAKDRSNASFSCGNAVVYHRTALESVGGFSEWNLVEDVHTSYRLHQAGWKTAYHPYAITTGTAPTTAAEYTKQRLRWSTDNFRLFLFQNPLTRRRLTIGQRLHYLHTTGFPIFNCFQILFMVCPVLFLIWHVQVLSFVAIPNYGAYALPYLCLLGSAMALYSGRGAGVRSLGAAVAAAPIGVLGMLQAASGKRVPTGVTRKDRRLCSRRLHYLNTASGCSPSWA